MPNNFIEQWKEENKKSFRHPDYYYGRRVFIWFMTIISIVAIIGLVLVSLYN